MEQFFENSQQYNENPNSKSQKHNKGSKGKKKPIKIKYISSPMMVRANNASEFRAIVQELTGQNSSITDISSDDQFVGHDQHCYDHDDQIITTTSWFPGTTDHHDYSSKVELVGRTDVEDDHEKFSRGANSSSIVNVPFGGQFDDEANHFWRSELVSDQSFNSGFQSPCVFVG